RGPEPRPAVRRHGALLVAARGLRLPEAHERDPRPDRGAAQARRPGAAARRDGGSDRARRGGRAAAARALRARARRATDARKPAVVESAAPPASRAGGGGMPIGLMARTTLRRAGQGTPKVAGKTTGKVAGKVA